MPTEKGEVEDAPVPGTFVYFHGNPKRSSSARVGWIVAENGCHIWQGCRSTDGYGRAKIDGRMQQVHRIRYEREVGPIPEGVVLDHFACDNPSCCNPAHVRPATDRENILRGGGVSAVHAAKTHCVHGHPFSGDNLYVTPAGYRRCRTCDRAREQGRGKRRRPLRARGPDGGDG